MSSTSIKSETAIRTPARSSLDLALQASTERAQALQHTPMVEMLALGNWRKCLLEIVVMLAVLSLAQHWLSDLGSSRGFPHPFWLPVLLASCQYGMSGGLLAAGTASLLFWYQLSPASATQDFYAYTGAIAVQPATWFATALVLGGLRNLHIHQARELTDAFAASRRKTDDLCRGFESALQEIDALERRIAVETTSVAALSRAFAQLDLRDASTIAESFGELFRVGTGLSCFTIYLSDGATLVPAYAIENDSAVAKSAITPFDVVQISATTDAGATSGPGYNVSEPLNDGRCVAFIPCDDDSGSLLAAIVWSIDSAGDEDERDAVRRRVAHFSRAFAALLMGCRHVTPQGRS